MKLNSCSSFCAKFKFLKLSRVKSREKIFKTFLKLDLSDFYWFERRLNFSNGPFPASFFSIVILSKQRVLAFCTKDILLVVSFELQISDGGSNHSTNCGTTSGLKNFMTKSFFVTTFNAAGRSFISTNEQKLLLPCLFLIPVDCIEREKQHFLRATKIAEIIFMLSLFTCFC